MTRAISAGGTPPLHPRLAVGRRVDRARARPTLQRMPSSRCSRATTSRERVQRGLRRAVAGGAARTGAARARADADDRAAARRDEMRERGLDRQVRGPQVERELGLERLDRRSGDRLAAREAAGGAARPRAAARPRRPRRRSHAAATAAGSREVGHDRLGARDLGARAAHGRDDAPAGLAEGGDDGAAEPARGAGDQHGAAHGTPTLPHPVRSRPYRATQAMEMQPHPPEPAGPPRSPELMEEDLRELLAHGPEPPPARPAGGRDGPRGGHLAGLPRRPRGQALPPGLPPRAARALAHRRPVRLGHRGHVPGHRPRRRGHRRAAARHRQARGLHRRRATRARSTSPTRAGSRARSRSATTASGA